MYFTHMKSDYVSRMEKFLFLFTFFLKKPFIEEEMNWLGKFSFYSLIYWKWNILLLEITEKDTVDKWDWH